jgi:hypothetical protein
MATMKDFQVTGKAFSPQKRTSSISRREISKLFFYFCGYLLPSWIRIRIPNPDPLT